MKKTILHTLKVLLLLYAGAVCLSWIIQWKFPTVDKPNFYQESTLLMIENSSLNVEFLRFSNPGNNSALLLLPDLYGGSEFLIPLALQLSDSVDVIIPIYPEESVSGPAPGYSIKDRAAIINNLVNALGLRNLHLAGQGYGGLIAMHLASDADKNDFISLSLLSSYGPQELQFLGNYYINRSLYSLLYPVVSVFKYGIPHMGWYDEQPVNFSLAHALMALDQRNVRDWAGQIEIPVLINQPLEDKYVSPAIGEELHRMIPQSIFSAQPADHLSFRENPSLWTPTLIWFTAISEDGIAPVRGEADHERIAASQKPFDAEEYSTIDGWNLIIILSLLILISLASEDLSAVGGGLLTAGGILEFHHAILGCVLGAILGDVSLYFLGSWIGNPILKYAPFRWIIKPEDIVRAERLFRMRGVGLIFAARFLPGTRFPIYFSSGLIQTKFTFFIGYFMLSLAIWAPLMVGLSVLVGQPMLSYMNAYKEQAVWIFPLLLLLLYGLIKLVVLISTVTGRRMLIVKIERFKRYFF